MKVVVFSLGCKVNQYEGQGIVNALRECGYDATDSIGFADAFILNTCSVTAEADKKSRQAVSRLRSFNPEAPIMVLGCSSQNDADRYLNKPNVRYVSGVGKKIDNALEFVSSIAQNEDLIVGQFDLPVDYEDNIFPQHTKTRSFVKIQDGCNNFCSYCRVPYLRGRSRSRSIDSIVQEANKAAEVSKEIVLTGIDISDYKTECGDLTTLVEALDIPVRKRLGSLECGIIDEKLLAAMQKNCFCDHFHLSLQSGSDSVLKRMNRHYTTEEYYEKVRLIRQFFPFAAITTDIIAGFSEETESEHKQTLEFVQKVCFADIHVFPYSERAGTAAMRLKQVDKRIRDERAKELAGLKTIYKERFLRQNEGRRLTVYAEESDGEYSVGYTENYIKVYSTVKVGEIGEINILKPFKDGVKGE